MGFNHPSINKLPVYQRLSRGKARKKQAIVALARKLLVRCWAMVRVGTRSPRALLN